MTALHELLAYGHRQFGSGVVVELRSRIDKMVAATLVQLPAMEQFDPDIGVYATPIEDTPFMLLNDFDETTLRLHLIVHARAKLADVDRSKIEW